MHFQIPSRYFEISFVFSLFYWLSLLGIYGMDTSYDKSVYPLLPIFLALLFFYLAILLVISEKIHKENGTPIILCFLALLWPVFLAGIIYAILSITHTKLS